MPRVQKNALQDAHEWFDLSKYDGVENFDYLDWLAQISKRTPVRDALVRRDKKALAELMPALQDAPLSGDVLHRDLLEQSDQEMGLTDVQGAVRSLRFSDLDRLHSSIETHSFNQYFFQENDAIEDMLLRCGMLGQLALRNYGYVVIHLGATKEEIENGVRDWLTKRREKKAKELTTQWADKLEADAAELESNPLLLLTEAKSRNARALCREFSDEELACLPEEKLKSLVCELTAMLRNYANCLHRSEPLNDVGTNARDRKRNRLEDRLKAWCDAKVLPYFDLKAWTALIGTKLSLHDLVELLKPHAPETDESFLKATDKYYKEIFRPDSKVARDSTIVLEILLAHYSRCLA